MNSAHSVPVTWGGVVQAAAEDDSAVLLFSGGYTRADAGQMSEAGSYWQVADALDWFGHDDVKLKTVLEVCGRALYSCLDTPLGCCTAAV